MSVTWKPELMVCGSADGELVFYDLRNAQSRLYRHRHSCGLVTDSSRLCVCAYLRVGGRGGSRCVFCACTK